MIANIETSNFSPWIKITPDLNKVFPWCKNRLFLVPAWLSIVDVLCCIIWYYWEVYTWMHADVYIFAPPLYRSDRSVGYQNNSCVHTVTHSDNTPGSNWQYFVSNWKLLWHEHMEIKKHIDRCMTKNQIESRVCSCSFEDFQFFSF